MSTITLTVPTETKNEIIKSKVVDWAEVASHAIHERASQLRMLKLLAGKSKLTKSDALDLSSIINQSLHKRYKKNS